MLTKTKLQPFLLPLLMFFLWAEAHRRCPSCPSNGCSQTGLSQAGVSFTELKISIQSTSFINACTYYLNLLCAVTVITLKLHTCSLGYLFSHYFYFRKCYRARYYSTSYQSAYYETTYHQGTHRGSSTYRCGQRSWCTRYDTYYFSQ